MDKSDTNKCDKNYGHTRGNGNSQADNSKSQVNDGNAHMDDGNAHIGDRNAYGDRNAGACSDSGQGEGDSNETKDDSCSKFGADLLQLYRSGQDSDATLKVGDARFQTHRCVLCARSEYFATMLNGSWSESSTSTITLEGWVICSLASAIYYKN